MRPDLTPEQQVSLDRLTSKGWVPDLTTLHYLPAEKAVAVKAVASLGSVIWFVIEPDGYTHS